MRFLDSDWTDRESVAAIRKATAEVATERINHEDLALAKDAARREFEAGKACRDALLRSGISGALLNGDSGLIAKWYDEFRAGIVEEK